MPEHDRRDRASPLVSVILPTHNSASFVSRAIDSVLDQEGGHALQLIVVDDCSGDETVALIQRGYASDRRINLIVSERNGGPGAARNRALAQARGEWIGLIDADDAWTADRLSTLMPLCTAEVDILFDNIIGYDQAAGKRTGLLFPSLPRSMTVPAMAADRAPESTFNFGYLKPLVRNDFLRRTGIRYPNTRISEDLLFYLEVLINGARTKTTNEGLYVYTTSLGQISGRRSTISATIPNDALVAHLLDELASKYSGQLNEDDLHAISARADRLRRLAPASQLYDHWSRGRYLAVARECFTNRSARTHLVRAISKRLFRAG